MKRTEMALDLTSIDPDPRTVTWTKEARVCVGRHACDWCLQKTPDPTPEQLLKFARTSQDTRTIWPFDGFWPTGWISLSLRRALDGEEEDRGSGRLCPDCSVVADARLQAAHADCARRGGAR